MVGTLRFCPPYGLLACSGSFGQMEEGLAVSFARAGKMNRALRILVCLVVAVVVVVGMVVPIVAYIVYRFVL